MDTHKKRSRVKNFGMALICIVAVSLSVFSIFSTYQLRKTADMIYEHPYTVSNEARAMRSRLLDMRGFLPNLIVDPASDIDEMRRTLEGRYSMQYAAIDIISHQYLGPAEDSERLLAAMQDLENTQDRELPVIFPMNREEIAQYASEHIYPKYDAVSEALDTIILFADSKIQSLERRGAETATAAIVSSVVLTIFLPAFFLITFWQERKNIREIQYR